MLTTARFSLSLPSAACSALPTSASSASSGPYNTAFVEKEVAAGARVIVTGRVRPGKLPEKLLAEGKAAKFLYPHHQSRGDLLRVAENNDFSVILPYHNEVKEVLVK